MLFIFVRRKKDTRNWFTRTFLLSFGVLTKRYQQSVLFRNVYKFLRHIALPFHDALSRRHFYLNIFKQTTDVFQPGAAISLLI